MFTGRKCCPVCHEVLPKFMDYIKKNYSGLVPDIMTVYDFWDKQYKQNTKRTYFNPKKYRVKKI